jgi:site-specific DNA recombinase
VKNPDTGKRITRINADGELYFADVPQLRIIAEDDWQRVQKIMARKSSGYATTAKRKSPHLFTGLMKCGQCGRSSSLEAVAHGHASSAQAGARPASVITTG